MDIVVDSNVLIADPWLTSQKTRMLLDFAHKMQARLVLPEVVEKEVAAIVERRLLEASLGVEDALKKGERIGLAGLPTFDARASASAAVEQWIKNFEKRIATPRCPRIQVDSAAAAEAVSRAARRQAPCAKKPEYRDALIWLGLLEFGRARQAKDELVFISMNTREFAGADGVSLHPDLAAEAHGLSLLYYPSLDAFLEVHAQRFAFLTLEWVGERLELDVVEDLLRGEAEKRLYGVKYRISGHAEDGGFYEPREFERVERAIVDVHDVFVWEFDDDHIEVSVSCSAMLEGQLICELTQYPYTSGSLYEHEMLEFEYPRSRSFSGWAEVGFDLAARVVDDELDDLRIEEIYGV